MCVHSLRYPACNEYGPYYLLWAASLCNIFPHYLNNGTIVEKKNLIEYKTRALIFSTNFVRNIFHSKNNLATYDPKCIFGFMYSARYSCQIPMNLEFCRQIFETILILTHSLTPWCRVLLEKLTGLQLVKKFPAFHGTRKFITALTGVRHLSLSWASPIQSIYPHPTSWISVLILSTHLRLGLPSGLLPSGFPSKTLYTSLSSPIRATCPAHLILLDFIPRTILGEE